MNPSTDWEAEETSERVAFTCSGCGQETVIHVGIKSALTDKRCMSCRGTLRTGRAIPAAVGKIGTHQGRIKDPERRKVKQAAAARNRSRRSGYRMSNGETGRMPCSSYDECHHRKHKGKQ